MIYLSGNNPISSNNYLGVQQFSSQPKALINKNTPMETDSVSFSGSNEKPKDKNNLTAYILGGLALAVGGILLAVNLKKGKTNAGDVAKDLKKGVEDLGKKESGHTGASTKVSGHSSSSTRSATSSTDKINVNDSAIQQKNATTGKHEEKIAEQERQISELKKKSAELDKKIAKLDSETPTVTSSQPAPKITENKKVTEPVPKKTPEDLLLNDSLDMYLEEVSKTTALKDKKALIREILPEFQKITKTNNGIISGIDDEKEILKILTSENKTFVIKEALPSILRNSESLKIRHVSEVKSALEVLKPETVSCLDKLAANAEKLKINNFNDTAILLENMTKENKDFAIDTLFPHLIANADKFKITRARDMACYANSITPKNMDFVNKDLLPHLIKNSEKYQIKESIDMASYIKAITPENKDFMVNEALPIILRNAEKLEFGGSEIAEIAGALTPNNLKNVQIIADNLDKFDIKDSMDCLDVDKFKLLLKRDSSELLKS